jgi:hypothetical protein
MAIWQQCVVNVISVYNCVELREEGWKIDFTDLLRFNQFNDVYELDILTISIFLSFSFQVCCMMPFVDAYNFTSH